MSIHGTYLGTGKGHSFAGSISGDFGSFHHNLIVNCAGAASGVSRAASTRRGEFAGNLDIRNNVVLQLDPPHHRRRREKLNFVNNYYIPGTRHHLPPT